MPPSKGDAGNSADPPEDPHTSAEEDHDSLEALLRKVDPNMTVPGTWIVPHLLKLAKETKSKKIESLIQLFFDPETVIQLIYVTTPIVLTISKGQHPESQSVTCQEALQPTRRRRSLGVGRGTIPSSKEPT